MFIYLDFFFILSLFPSPNQTKLQESLLKELLNKNLKKKSSFFMWSIKSLQRADTQMEVKLPQNVPFNWKQAQKNNTLCGQENWLFKILIEGKV